MTKPHLNTSVGRLRLCGMFEAISFLLLLGIAMPLKYLAGWPMAVRWVGMAHGVLFMLYVLLVLLAWLDKKIPVVHALLAVICSVIPFGPFLIDRKLAADETRADD